MVLAASLVGQSPMSIVVGIDGSDAGVRAAQWAVDEAVSRDLPLRLVHVIEPGSEAVRLETEYAQLALQTARAAVEALSPRVRIETAVKRGDIGAVLARESRNAEMICIGSAATGGLARQTASSTSTALARSAQSPVAVIGTPDGSVEPQKGCLAVIVDGSGASDLMVEDAFNEARLRGLSMMVVEAPSPTGDDPSRDSFGQRIAQLRLGYPDVAVHCVAVQTDVGAFLAEIGPSVAMTIVGGAGLDEEARLVNSHTEQPMLHQRAERELSLVSGKRSPSTRKVVVVEQDSKSGERTQR